MFGYCLMTEVKPLARPCAPVWPSAPWVMITLPLPPIALQSASVAEGAHELVVGGRGRWTFDLVDGAIVCPLSIRGVAASIIVARASTPKAWMATESHLRGHVVDRGALLDGIELAVEPGHLDIEELAPAIRRPACPARRWPVARHWRRRPSAAFPNVPLPPPARRYSCPDRPAGRWRRRRSPPPEERSRLVVADLSFPNIAHSLVAICLVAICFCRRRRRCSRRGGGSVSQSGCSRYLLWQPARRCRRRPARPYPERRTAILARPIDLRRPIRAICAALPQSRRRTR